MSRKKRSGPERPVWRRRFTLAGWLLAGGILLARGVQVQILEGHHWERLAEQQQRRSVDVPAPRGSVLDRRGSALAVSHERLRVSVAPREISDRAATASLLHEVLGLSSSAARRVVRSKDPWIVLPGRYDPAVRERLGPVRGVYLEEEPERLLPHGQLALGVLGRVREGRGHGGVEEALDSVLAGQPGQEVQARDNVGRPIPGETFVVRPPRSGNDVTLSLDLDLQEIAHQALSQAMEETGARGGDLVITDPTTGEVLALVSLGEKGSPALTAINAPYEPGSILKPFTVAGLLSRNLASLSDSLDTEGGVWRWKGRTLHDDHRFEHGISLADALRVSSNIGIAKAARALSPAQQYENLRDFGFGAPTGIPLPGESSGTLRRPARWSLQSPASLAIGYEIGVTPIQMAMAYGALANGGWLMEPLLVEEVRAPDGTVLERHAPRRIRRVVSRSVARKVDGVLAQVVEDGTGTQARLSTFRVAGKTGTSRAYASDGGYEGGYYASFASFFPADDPQLVVFVKLARPQSSIYGGSTAAPVTRATLEAILAARKPPLDRHALVRTASRGRPAAQPRRDVAGSARLASFRLPPAPSAATSGADAPFPVSPVPDASGKVPVPDVEGLPLREATRRLHSMGFRVVWAGGGAVRSVRPAPGRHLSRGDTVRIGGER